MNTTQQALLTFAAATHNELFDPEYNGGEWMIEAVQTAETIEQFVESSNKWASCTKDQFGEIAGFKFVAWHEVQGAKGQQRRSLSVIDFGDFRMALNCDLTYF
ncbi:MAG: hypothetical protein HKM00_09690 [Gallionella sp.]|nr:hypothetical protein [Gallionella sp.]